jgi:hypothetical protein
MPSVCSPRFLTLLLLGLAACGDPGSAAVAEGDATADGEAIAPLPDAEADEGSAAPDVAPDAAPDAGDADAGDEAGCATVGCVCSGDLDCASGYCVRVPGAGKVCAGFCDESCSLEGWECRLLENSGGDVVELCVPIGDRLLRPVPGGH